MKEGYFYILASDKYGTLYTGVTNSIIRRIIDHKTGRGSDFTRKYNIYTLVYYEHFERIGDAIKREKQIKNWHRNWKLDLIETINPDWRDLYEEAVQG